MWSIASCHSPSSQKPEWSPLLYDDLDTLQRDYGNGVPGTIAYVQALQAYTLYVEYQARIAVRNATLKRSHRCTGSQQVAVEQQATRTLRQWYTLWTKWEESATLSIRTHVV